jgi:hypothetical protein
MHLLFYHIGQGIRLWKSCFAHSFFKAHNARWHLSHAVRGVVMQSAVPVPVRLGISKNNYLLTTWSRELLEKVTGLELVKKFPAFCGTRRFLTALTSTRQVSLSWASTIQSSHPHPTSWRYILSFHLRLGLPSGLFPSGFPHEIPVHTSPFPRTCYMPRPSHSSRFYYMHGIG